MTKHTPGPWFAGSSGRVYAEGGQNLVASVNGTSALPIPAANARLIAAAPELLAACEDALNNLPADGECAAFIRAALAKVNGEGQWLSTR